MGGQGLLGGQDPSGEESGLGQASDGAGLGAQEGAAALSWRVKYGLGASLDGGSKPRGTSGDTEPEALRFHLGGTHSPGVSEVAFQHGRDLVGEFPARELEGDLEVETEGAVVEVGRADGAFVIEQDDESEEARPTLAAARGGIGTVLHCFWRLHLS